MSEKDEKILSSWHRNAAAWTRAVREREIESRRLVTDRAIVEAVLAHPARSALDIGCGEGWLVRELTANGLTVTGLDAVPDLVEAARDCGSGRFLCLSYEELAERGLDEVFDVVVCNFSLLGGETVDKLIRGLPALLAAGGRLVVQTLNPNLDRGSERYRDGWREGSWQGFSADFVDPAPWYFRSTETWVSLFRSSGFHQVDIREPLHPLTGLPASIVFTARI